MPSQVSFKGNWDVTNDTANDVVNIGHDNGGQFQFVTDGVVQELNGGDGVSFKFDTNARTAKFVNADGTDALVVNDSGPIEMLHNGTVLDPTSSGLTDGGSINSTTQTFRGYYDSDGTTSITASGVDASFQHVANSDGSSSLDASVQATKLLSLNSGGPVEVLNAELDLNSSNVINIRNLKMSHDNSRMHTSGSGTGSVGFHDRANGNTLLKANEGGPLEVRNSNLQLSPNQLIKFTDINASDAVTWPNQGGAGGDMKIFGDGSGEIVAEDDAGNQTTLT